MIVTWCVANEERACVSLCMCVRVCAEENNVSELCSHQTEPKGPMQRTAIAHRPVRKNAYRVTKYESEAVIHSPLLVSASLLYV